MKRDLSDFKYYSHSGKRWLAVFITKDNLEDISKKSGLIVPFNKWNTSFCFGILAVARVDQWLVLKLDQRNDRPMSRDVISPWLFERDYKYMVNKNKEVI